MILEEVKIEQALSTDIEDIFKLEQKSFGKDSFSKKQFSYLLQKANSDFIVARGKQQIIAYMIILKRKRSLNNRIYSIAIAPEARGLGLAKKLLDFAENLARNDKKIQLSLEVNINNKPAIELYLKKGFETVGVKENYYHDGSSAFVMKKKL